MTAEYCLDNMSRPQLMIWYAKTVEREYNTTQGRIQADWSRTANLLAMIHNTSMGVKRKVKASDAMPDFQTFAEVMKGEKEENIFDKAEKLGLKTPSKRKL